jgi:hypothetical protein
MLVSRKFRNKIIILVLILLAFVVWRGTKAATKDDFTCSYKLYYAVCKPKNQNAQFPSIMQILTAGVKF